MTTVSQVTFTGQPVEVLQRILDACRKLRNKPILNASTGKIGVVEAVYVEAGKIWFRNRYPDA